MTLANQCHGFESHRTHTDKMYMLNTQKLFECTYKLTFVLCSHIDYEEDFEADDEVEENPSPAANGGEKETETRDENDINEEKSNSDSDDASMSSTYYFMIALFSKICQHVI